MQSRLLALTLALYLAFTLLACSKKADQTAETSTDATSAETTAPAETKAPAGTKAPVAKARSEQSKKPKVETVVIPAGTTLTVRLGQALGSKLSQAGQSFPATLANSVAVGARRSSPPARALRAPWLMLNRLDGSKAARC